MNSRQLCIIDKDADFIRVLDKMAEAAGWRRRIFGTAPQVDQLASMRLDALVVDIDALGSQGWEFLELASGFLPDLGVIVCTGESSVKHRVRALNMGVDDWMTKPCHPEEVLARVEAVTRRLARGRANKDVGTLVVGEVEIRPDQYQAFVEGRSIELTRREFELFHLLATAGGQVVERHEIYKSVWGFEMAHGDRSIDVYVRKLRKKLHRSSPGWNYIHTHFGIGYRLHAESATEPRKVQETEDMSVSPEVDDQQSAPRLDKPPRKAAKP